MYYVYTIVKVKHSDNQQLPISWKPSAVEIKATLRLIVSICTQNSWTQSFFKHSLCTLFTKLHLQYHLKSPLPPSIIRISTLSSSINVATTFLIPTMLLSGPMATSTVSRTSMLIQPLIRISIDSASSWTSEPLYTSWNIETIKTRLFSKRLG